MFLMHAKKSDRPHVDFSKLGPGRFDGILAQQSLEIQKESSRDAVAHCTSGCGILERHELRRGPKVTGMRRKAPYSSKLGKASLELDRRCVTPCLTIST
jgi:hypothetical protein